jgi:ketosteroid isomerase-like protein
MRKKSALTVAAIVVASLALAAADKFAPPDAAGALRRQALKYVAAFRTENPTDFAELEGMLADDFVQVGSDGNVYEGREANLKLYRNAIVEIREAFETLDIRLHISKVRVSRDAGYVFGKIVSSGKLKDGRRFHREVWETIIFRRVRGRWIMVHEHSSRIRPQAR